MTTRAIAEAVPCSEGAIYVHFKDRLDLVLEVLQQSLPDMLVSLHGLMQKAGTATPEQNLSAAVGGLSRFHRRVTPMLCSLISEPELLERFRASLKHSDKGPHRGIGTIASYIREEQKLGRIKPELDAQTAASVLMANSLFHEFTARLLGSTKRLESKRLVQLVLGTESARPFEGLSRIRRYRIRTGHVSA
jgi:AcrR family transcriptional regulator